MISLILADIKIGLKNIDCKLTSKEHNSVADLHGKIWTLPPPSSGCKFLQFHAVFGKIWQNRMLVPLWRVGASTSGKSWIHHCN